MSMFGAIFKGLFVFVIAIGLSMFAMIFGSKR
jgi:hypothetical protein